MTPSELDALGRGEKQPWDGWTSAEKMGVLTRSCAAFGVQAWIVGKTCASPFLRPAVRNSMGTII